MKTVLFSVMVLVASLTTGCASLWGTGGNEVWTYNLQQSLARSGGDVAITMMLDQGVDKAKATEAINVLIKIIGANAPLRSVMSDLNAQAALFPAVAEIVKKIESIIPSNLTANDPIPEDVKALLISFLRDGALHGISLYKDANKTRMVAPNDVLSPSSAKK